MRQLPKKIVSTLLIILFINISIFATAQTRMWYINNKLVDSFHSPIVQYFSKRYDTAIVYDNPSNWSDLKHPFKVFAIKNNRYFKISGIVGFFINDKFYLDSIAIKQTKQCDNKEGKTLLAALDAHYIFTLPLDNNSSPCEFYDSVNKRTLGFMIEDAGEDRFQFFNKTTYRSVDYYAIKDYNKVCPKEQYKNTIALIELFKKDWQFTQLKISLFYNTYH